MINSSRIAIRSIAVASAACAFFAVEANAHAQRYYVREPEPSAYPIEIEPHFAFGAENVYGTTGVGAGLRVSVPFIGSLLPGVPDNLAVSFGGDVLHYDNCYYGTRCGANYVMLPLALQWNVFITRHFSLFLEGGAFFYKGFFDGCSSIDGPGCSAPSDIGVLPTVAVGARIHLSPYVALTGRLGYPTSTLGVSFL